MRATGTFFLLGCRKQLLRAAGRFRWAQSLRFHLSYERRGATPTRGDVQRHVGWLNSCSSWWKNFSVRSWSGLMQARSISGVDGGGMAQRCACGRAGGPLGGRGARRGGRRAALLTRCRARVAALGGFTTRDVVLATRRGSRTQSPQHHSNPPTRYMNRSPQAVSETLPQRHVILLVIGISLAPRKTLICTGGSAAGLWARPTVTIREWLRTVATIPPRCFFFTTLLTSPGGTRPQPSQRLGLYASLGPNAPFFSYFHHQKTKKTRSTLTREITTAPPARLVSRDRVPFSRG